MMEFLYTDDPSPYKGLLDAPLAGMRSKHVLSLASGKARGLLEASCAVGYPQAVWGYGSGIWQYPRENRIIQMDRIQRMVYKQHMAPLRIVIDPAGVPWADNLHSAIRDLLVFGMELTAWDSWHYIVDLSQGVPRCVAKDGSLSSRVPDICGAVACARKRAARADDAVRGIGYTIGEFMEENHITKEALCLAEAYFEAYRNAHAHRKGAC